MKKYISLSLIIGVAMIFGSCKKEGQNIFNMFTDVKVELHNNDPHNIVGEKQINVGDEIWIDYTITSPNNDMYVVNLLEAGNSTPIQKYTCTTSERHTVSGIFKVTPSRTGDVSYRIYPTDKTGIYLGDGGILLTVHVTNDFTFVTERHVEMPNPYVLYTKADSAAGTISYGYPIGRPDYFVSVQSFLSLSEGQTYSFTDGVANSAKIDFGIYYKPTITRTVDKTTGAVILTKVDHYYFYTPGSTPAPVLPIAGFDFTGWTAKGTLFSDKQANTAFTGIKTGQQIATAAAKVAVTLTNPEMVIGSAYYFKTKDGKYGIVYPQTYNSDKLHPNPNVNFAYKVQL